jgi:2-keto-4-pentenoate hydratase/2-oxohepta-3-ene-1,7-dioic acid hydratase in catechol pathway
MPLALFSTDGPARLAKVFGDRLIDLTKACPDLPRTTIDFLAAGEAALNLFKAVEEDADIAIPISDVRLHAPVPAPEKYLAIGMNYEEHAQEARDVGYDVPEYQLWFNKQVSCINGPFDDVIKPAESDQLDCEAELVVVIGKTCRRVPVENARSVIGGYMIANDVSVRDWQKRSQTMTLGKSWDTHGPLGPWLTLDHEIEDPMALRVRMLVNGEERQNDRTSSMIYDIYEQIAYLSTVMTLKPGDVLTTGTPSGIGLAMTPPLFLKIGDIMRVEIEGLGHIENRVVAER